MQCALLLGYALAGAPIPIHVEPVPAVGAHTGGTVDLSVPLIATTTKPIDVHLELLSLVATDAPQLAAVPCSKTPAPSIAVNLAGTSKVVPVPVCAAEPGSYQAKVLIESEGYNHLTTTATVYVRSAWWMAAILISLGVLIAAFFQGYGSALRPRLLRLQRLDRYRVAVEELARSLPKDDFVSPVVNAVLTSLRKRDDGDFDQAALSAAESRIRVLKRWVELATRFGRLAVEEQEMIRIGGELRLSEGDWPGNLTKLDEVETALKKEYTDRLRWEIDAAIASLPADDPLKKETIEALAANPSIEALIRLRRRVSEKAVALLAEDLERRAASPAPLGVADATWAEERRKLSATAAEMRGRSFAEATLRYEAAIQSSMRVALEGLRSKAPAPSPTGKEVTDAARTQLREDLDTALNQRLDKTALERTYRELDQRLREVLAGPQHRGHDPNLGSPPIARRVETAEAPEPIEDTQPPVPLDFSIEPESARTWRMALDLVAFAVVWVFTTVFGLVTLYFSDPSWGGWDDLLKALLWGLGLYQLGQAGIGAPLTKMIAERSKT